MKDNQKTVQEKEQRFLRPLFTVTAAFFVTLAVEMLSRRSFTQAFVFLWQNPLLFLYNTLIVFFTLSFSLLFKKRRVMLGFLSSIWLIMGIITFVIQSYRSAPFSAIDFFMLRFALTISDMYLPLWSYIAIGIASLLFLCGIVFAFIRGKKETCDYRSAARILAIAIILLAGATFGLRHGGLLPSSMEELGGAYREYGFVYCFSSSFVDQGIDEPDDYSPESVDSILTAIGATPEPDEDVRTNIIFVQLESFFNTNDILNVNYSENPVPTFSSLLSSCPSGRLNISTIGGGTANTEFEVLTGMSLDFFGPGEYPYETVLQGQACETIAYNMKELGCATHALHNHRGSFYDRNIVYPNLGFDTFSSIEYMQNITCNKNGWAKDDVLLNEILTVLSSTDSLDFIFTVTVEGHGPYSDVPLTDDGITLIGLEDESVANMLTRYVRQQKQTDDFIASLLDAFTDYHEPVVLVLYGDHLPNLGLTDENMAGGTLLSTNYVVWSNFGLTGENMDLEAYQLSARVMELMGQDTGVFTKLHQQYSKDDNYQQALEMLEYDVLYGNHATYNGIQKYKPTAMRMGTLPITVWGKRQEENKLYVFGENFTPWSVVQVNGASLPTQWVNANILLTEGSFSQGQSLSVSQVGDDGTVLSTVVLEEQN